MRVGGEQSSKIVVLAVLLAGGAAAYFWGGGLAAGSGLSLAGGSGNKLPDLARLDPTLHMTELDRLRAIDYTGGDRDLFHYAEPAPPPPPRPVTPPSAPGRGGMPGTPGGPPVVPSGPPAPPPIPLQFYGMATPSGGGPPKVFLRMGDTDYVKGDGETIENRYVIQKIDKLSVHVKDLQTGQEQDLPLYQG